MSHDNSMLVYADGDVRAVLQSGPVADRAATRALIDRLYPGRTVTAVDDGTMFANCAPEDGTVYAAVFPGLTVICDERFRGSDIRGPFLAAGRGRTVYAHSAVSGGGFVSFAVWDRTGELRRHYCLLESEGVLADEGDPLPFEKDGDVDALRALFGYTYQGEPLPDDPDLTSIVLPGYRIGSGRSVTSRR